MRCVYVRLGDERPFCGLNCFFIQDQTLLQKERDVILEICLWALMCLLSQALNFQNENHHSFELRVKQQEHFNHFWVKKKISTDISHSQLPFLVYRYVFFYLSNITRMVCISLCICERIPACDVVLICHCLSLEAGFARFDDFGVYGLHDVVILGISTLVLFSSTLSGLVYDSRSLSRLHQDSLPNILGILSLSLSLGSLILEKSTVSRPAERPMWQSTDTPCQQPCEQAWTSILQTQSRCR